MVGTPARTAAGCLVSTSSSGWGHLPKGPWPSCFPRSSAVRVLSADRATRAGTVDRFRNRSGDRCHPRLEIFRATAAWNRRPAPLSDVVVAAAHTFLFAVAVEA